MMSKSIVLPKTMVRRSQAGSLGRRWRWSWRWLASCLTLHFIALLAAAEPSPNFEIKTDKVTLRCETKTFDVSLKSPSLLFEEIGTVGNTLPTGTTGDLADGKTLEVSYATIPAGPHASIDIRLFLRWSEAEAVLRKWATIRLNGPQEGILLKEVILDRIDTHGQSVWMHGESLPDKSTPTTAQYQHSIFSRPDAQSHPLFMAGCFFGMEYPVAATRREEGQIVLSHRPGKRLLPGADYETRTAVFGVAPIGSEIGAFRRYIAAKRPSPRGIHINYNSWWTSPIPRYAESDILGLTDTLRESLTKPRAVAFDSFCIDMGWSDSKSIWEIDTQRLPQGLAPIQSGVEQMQSRLGLWISPSAIYSDALDVDWAKRQGFESNQPSWCKALCLGGPKYAERFKERLADLVSHHGLSQMKLDGYIGECQETGHGHQPGILSGEPIAEGMIAAVGAARKANPTIWIEATCFGWNPSPWWLCHVNSLIGDFGDDAPAGRVPCPVYRESYTTARDFFNLQGASLLPIPINAQEVLGIIHQSPEPFLNDAVTTVLRGHMFLPLYVNPKFMDGARWDSLAALVKWARNNTETLDQTVPLLPIAWQKGMVPQFTDDAAMPREPYGYAHVKGNAGLILLRNPWIAKQSYAIKLNEGLGFSTAADHLLARSLYPEPRMYGEKLKYGDVLEVTLAPYETIVLAVNATPIEQDRELPKALATVGTQLTVDRCEHKLQRIAFKDSGASMGPDWTCRLGDVATAAHLTFNASVQVKSPQADLLILCEGEKAPMVAEGQLTINGSPARMDNISSASGWFATVLPQHEHWTFLRAPLAAGRNEISLDQYIGDDCAKVSVWVCATKPGGVSTYPNALPQPETIWLDGAAMVSAVELKDVPAEAVRVERPVDRIDGVFLDAMEPVSVAQGWGTLQKNQSVWEKPMMIGGNRFARGLGTHAPSKIVFDLEGKYRRFQTRAGADGNTTPTVTFELRVDGVSRWKSDLMTRETPAAWVDVDIAGAKTLELIVGDGGNGIGADHADWGDARLLR